MAATYTVTNMGDMGVAELLLMLLVTIVSMGIPIATLVFVILIYKNTRK
jgi:hypothetical protein